MQSFEQERYHMNVLTETGLCIYKLKTCSSIGKGYAISTQAIRSYRNSMATDGISTPCCGKKVHYWYGYKQRRW